MPQSSDTQLLEQEQWLRTNGLPLVVPPSRRFRGLIPRTVPLLVTFAFLAIGLVMIETAVPDDESVDLLDVLIRPDQMVLFIVAAVVVVLAIPLGVAYAWLQRKLSTTWRMIVGAIIIVFWLAGLSVIATATHTTGDLHVDILSRLGLLLIAALIGFYGLGNMLRWAAKRGARELAVTLPAVARILPLLLLTVLLVFFTNELWQLSATITLPRMWMLSGFLVLMILLIALPATFDMIEDEKDDDAEEPLLAATPFVGIAARRSRLSLGERFNLIAVSLTVQFVQISMFVIVTFIVFALFGAITITDDLIATWTGQAARPMVFLGIRMPIEAHMFRVCLILALFSGISFAASMLQDTRYRTLFLDRVAEDVQRNLAARHRYRMTLKQTGRGPQRWLSLADDDSLER